MTDHDNRDAETIMRAVADEFRRACEAQRDFLAWYSQDQDVPFVERLRRYSEMVAASEPWADSYRRISTRFPQYMDRLHELLLPIQDAIFPTGVVSPGVQQQVGEPRTGRHKRR